MENIELEFDQLYVKNVKNKLRYTVSYIDKNRSTEITSNDSLLSEREILNYYLNLFSKMTRKRPHEVEVEEVIIDNIFVSGFRLGLRKIKKNYYYELVGTFLRQENLHHELDKLLFLLKQSGNNKKVKMYWNEDKVKFRGNIYSANGFLIPCNRIDILLNMLENLNKCNIIGAKEDKVLKKTK